MDNDTPSGLIIVGYAMMRHGKVEGLEQTAAQADRWVDATRVPLTFVTDACPVCELNISEAARFKSLWAASCSESDSLRNQCAWQGQQLMIAQSALEAYHRSWDEGYLHKYLVAVANGSIAPCPKCAARDAGIENKDSE